MKCRIAVIRCGSCGHVVLLALYPAPTDVYYSLPNLCDTCHHETGRMSYHVYTVQGAAVAA